MLFWLPLTVFTIRSAHFPSAAKQFSTFVPLIVSAGLGIALSLVGPNCFLSYKLSQYAADRLLDERRRRTGGGLKYHHAEIAGIARCRAVCRRFQRPQQPEPTLGADAEEAA